MYVRCCPLPGTPVFVGCKNRENQTERKKMTVREHLWAFEQDIIKRANSGYIYACVVNYPLKKEDKWSRIDKKLTKKLNLGLTRNQRAYRKQKNIANYFGCRYKNCVFLQKTPGKSLETDDEQWQNIARKPLKIKITEHLTLEIGFYPNFGKKCVIKLSKQCFKELKALARLGSIQKDTRIYKQLSDLPAVTHPFHLQKKRLLKIASFKKKFNSVKRN